ncbi:putative cyclin-L1 [Apostichopus japonicus]|uniref:Putative cyclin-L1 n=1 Tax=Stichopus japonicus TaxID=307972 RepID=A0A2G8JWM3_STIJA|nr:putative cyclin-L1 [Apostichopus japonicus]
MRRKVAMATAQVLFQRFYYSKSFVKHNMEIVAMACINLASKIEEEPRRLRDVINVFYHIKQKSMNKHIEPMVLDSKYITLKNNSIKAERRVLKELGFCVHVKHPHKMIVMYLQLLELQSNKRLVQTAWNYMNDSLRTDVFVRYPPETIACACIYLSARQLQVVLPESPDWYGLMGATLDEMEDIALTILRLYTFKLKPYSELDREVEKCRVILQAAKMKAKGLLNAEGLNSAAGTPQNFSPHSNSTQNSPKVKTESPGLPNSYKLGNSLVKEESNGSTAAVKKENGKIAEVKKSSKSRSRSRSASSVEKFKSPPPISRKVQVREETGSLQRKDKRRRKRDDPGGRRHHPRSRKRSIAGQPLVVEVDQDPGVDPTTVTNTTGGVLLTETPGVINITTGIVQEADLGRTNVPLTNNRKVLKREYGRSGKERR